MGREGDCTIKGLAKELGLSHSTVSRVLNNASSKFITEATRKRVLECAARRGYVPNKSARSLSKAGSELIGLVVSTGVLDGSSSTQIGLDRPLANALSGIARVLNKAGRRLLLAICDKPFIQRREYVSLFKERSLDGMIIWGAKREELFWNELAGRNVVMANSRSLSNPFPYVGTDNAKAARECCELMIARGRERILYLDCCASVSIADERFAGYREAHAKAGRPFDPGLVVRSDDLRFCVERAVALKKADPRAFDAVHCVNEALAIFLGIELERLGLSIPSDVALIGGDRLEDRYSPAFNMRFPILSFQPDCVRLGELAAQALLPEEGTPPAAETLLPAKILDCE